MDAEDAAATGAHVRDVDPTELASHGVNQTAPARHRQATEADLQVPGGATDPLWYVAAHHLCPHMESTRKRGWVEGFVSALELLRGVNLDVDVAVSDVLRDTTDLRFPQDDTLF